MVPGHARQTQVRDRNDPTIDRRRPLGLIQGFIESSLREPKRPALFVAGRLVTYEELRAAALSMAATIKHAHRGDGQLIAILGSRSFSVYAGILGILASGRGYVPLNPKFPPERLARIIELSGISSVIVCPEAALLLPKLKGALTEPIQWLDGNAVTTRTAFDGNDLPPAIDEKAIAYLLFTSGSTGEPKGVAIRHCNVMPYIQWASTTYGFHLDDRFSQAFELTFDVSVHDMFVCWENGACLYVVPETDLSFPSKFINENRLTCWYSVPSVISTMARLRLLKPGSLPTLRYSFFAGEALSIESALLWATAAANSRIENLFGPTEATITIASHSWNGDRTASSNGTVPIGKINPGHQYALLDENDNEVPVDGLGELCVTGPQVALGYFHAQPERRDPFFRRPGSEALWYRTGDLVSCDAQGNLIFRGRTDSQVKVRGHRVELLEVDHWLQKILLGCQVVSLSWPFNNLNCDCIYSAIETSEQESLIRTKEILDQCRALLPEYMLPKDLFFLRNFPLNSNGKIDRKEISTILTRKLDANRKTGNE